jgi:hypothetical protein
MNYGPLFRQLSESYGWSPAQIGKLTWRQVAMYMDTDEDKPKPEGTRQERRIIRFRGDDCMDQLAAWRQQNGFA